MDGKIMDGKSMTAVVTYAPGDYRCERIPVPQPGPGEILLKVEACGICAGDLKAFQGGKRFWGGGLFEPYIESGCVGGHEFVGRVAALGAGTEGRYAAGDRLIAEQIVPCGECAYCRRGLYWMCDPHEVFGFKKHLNGGFAEYMILPAKSLKHRVPDSLSRETAALIEPLSCSLHAVERGRPEPGDVVVVSGSGALGLGMVTLLKSRYKVTVVALDLSRRRLDQALRAGADLAMNPRTDPVKEKVASLTGGLGCDVYIEATGHPDSVSQGLALIRKKGRFVEFSVFNDDVVCDFSVIGDGKELDLYGVSLSPYCYEPVIASLATGALSVDGIVTHSYPIERFAEAFRTAQSDPEAIKVLLVPEGAS